MASFLRVPITKWDKASWGALNYFGNTHVICAERLMRGDENYTFAGGHRVRLFTVRNNVHWKIPEGIQLDISSVPSANPARRLPR